MTRRIRKTGLGLNLQNTIGAGGFIELFKSDAASFAGVATYNWAVYGTNTILNDSNTLKITYVDDTRGAYLLLKSNNSIISNLVVDATYRFVGYFKVNAGSSLNAQIHNSISAVTSDALISETFVPVQLDFIAKHTTDCLLKFVNMSAGEIVWLDNLSLKRIA